MNPAYQRMGIYKNGKTIILTTWPKKQGMKNVVKHGYNPCRQRYFNPPSSDEEK